MSEECSHSNYCGRSPSRIRIHGRGPSHYRSFSRIPRKRCRHSASRSVDAYYIAGMDAGHKIPSTSTECGEESEIFQDRWI